jgi:hypothetical protein
MIWKAMFAPLDICIRQSSAINYSVRSKFTGRTTWSSVRDSREEEASTDVLVADNAPSAFCNVEIECFKIRDGKKKPLIEVFVDMQMDDGHGIDLGKFPVEATIKDIWGFYPSVTTGTGYDYEYSKERGPEQITKKTMNVRTGASYGEFSSRALEDLDLEGAGDEIADRVGVMNATYCVTKNITTSENLRRDDESNLGEG